MLLPIVAAFVPLDTKPVVVMVHGAGGGGWEYDFWKPVWQKAGFTVIAKDLEPIGGDYGKTTFDDYEKQVESWGSEAVKAKKPLVLVGASMGGILALKAAEHLHPAAIVLVNSVPPKGVVEPKDAPPLPDIVRWKGGPVQDTRDSLPDGDEQTVQYCVPRWRDESGTVMNSIRAGISAEKPTCPVLVVIGKADTDVPPASSQALAKWAGADAFCYEGTSHIGPLFGFRRVEIASQVISWVKHRLHSPSLFLQRENEEGARGW